MPSPSQPDFARSTSPSRTPTRSSCPSGCPGYSPTCRTARRSGSESCLASNAMFAGDQFAGFVRPALLPNAAWVAFATVLNWPVLRMLGGSTSKVTYFLKTLASAFRERRISEHIPDSLFSARDCNLPRVYLIHTPFHQRLIQKQAGEPAFGRLPHLQRVPEGHAAGLRSDDGADPHGHPDRNYAGLCLPLPSGWRLQLFRVMLAMSLYAWPQYLQVNLSFSPPSYG